MEFGEGAGVAEIKVDPDKYLKAKVVEITFDGYDACREQAKVTGPHWPAETDGYNKSRKAAVLQLGKDKKSTAKVKVNIDSKGISGNGKLVGRLGNLVFEGEVPLAKKGEPTVTVTIKENPDALLWARGNMTWEINGGELISMAGVTNVELFYVFDNPAAMKFFKDKGVWVEALRFIFEEGKLERTVKMKEALGKVTGACFSLPQHDYDIRRGASTFGGYKGFFALGDYMRPIEYNVNCYDQAYAVIVFSGAIGVAMQGLYLDPYGYLKLTGLVGRGSCNNPFPNAKYKNELESYMIELTEGGQGKRKIPALEDYLVVDPKDRFRSAFGNHMFCEYGSDIYDACAGPAKGEHDREGYLLKNVDTVIPDFKKYDFPASVEEISHNSRNSIRGIDDMRREVSGKTYKVDAHIRELDEKIDPRRKLLTTAVEVDSVK